MNLPPPECPYGYSVAQLATIFGEALPVFYRWMSGQTQSVCEGRRYNHDLGRYEPSECAANPHGVVTYKWDVERFIDGRPVVD